MGGQPGKRICVGLLAHVDAGKTTLSEALLYHAGALRKLGRVDHRDAFLDHFDLERERGITIFSKQAILTLGDTEVTLMDTPGHADFSAEAERTLQVLDCAVLIVSASDGVQAHTLTLWRLLERYGVPTLLFLNKMDLPNPGPAARLDQLRARLDDRCVDFTRAGEDFFEGVATCDEGALETYLETGSVPDGDIAALIAGRKLFPCFFGSALRVEGVAELAAGLARYVRQPRYPEQFAAKVYKIGRDAQGARLTWLKVTGGVLRVKDVLTNRRAGLSPERIWEEKADQLRLYSGVKYTAVEEVPAGAVCAVTGLTRTRPGMGLGGEPDSEDPLLAPVLTYRLLLPGGVDPHAALPKLAQLEEEDPQLRILWDEPSGQLQIRLMGEVQLETLQRLIADRFGWEVTFGEGAIVYRETIATPVLGIGHFEPLRHYAEVHLLLEPLERGAGLHFASLCGEDVLARNWQRLVLTHLEEKLHRGVLTGSPIADLRISVVAGRAHPKHTEGGDFRQATYRAVRQGLMSAESILLEPWYDFRLEIPAQSVGRAMSDLQRMCGVIEVHDTLGDEAVLTGRAPVSELRDYAAQVTAYTRGQGRLSCTLRGYDLCHNAPEVIAAMGYDPERDAADPAGSVFCAHGAGFAVRWDEVPAHAHVDSGLRLGQKPSVVPPQSGRMPRRAAPSSSGAELDKELESIFEKTYGPIKSRSPRPLETPKHHPDQRSAERSAAALRKSGPEYLLVDGYNIIFAWEDLRALARESLEGARAKLTDILCSYQGWRGCEVILVFDAYKVPHGTGEVEKHHNIHVVYTREAETADNYIEKATRALGRDHRVTVATSDSVEQLIILGHGALRLSARAFRQEVEEARRQMESALAAQNRTGKSPAVRDALERAGWERDTF